MMTTTLMRGANTDDAESKQFGLFMLSPFIYSISLARRKNTRRQQQIPFKIFLVWEMYILYLLYHPRLWMAASAVFALESVCLNHFNGTGLNIRFDTHRNI